MIKVIVYTNKFGKKGARLVADLGYKQVVLSWDIQLCAEILRCSVIDLIEKEHNSTLIVQ